MGSKIDSKKFALAVLAVFVVVSIIEYILHTFILGSIYARPEYQVGLFWPTGDYSATKWLYLGYLLFAGLFTFVYTRGYEAKPALSQGLRYGVYIGLLLYVPSMFIQHGLLLVPKIVILSWGVAGFVECIVSGILVARIHRPPATTS